MEWLVVMLVSVVAIIAVASMARQRQVERRRLAELEARTRAMMQQYGTQPPAPYQQDLTGFPQLPPGPIDPRLDEVRQLVVDGQKIAAIKRYREITGAGLTEAKRFVDRLDRQF